MEIYLIHVGLFIIDNKYEVLPVNFDIFGAKLRQKANTNCINNPTKANELYEIGKKRSNNKLRKEEAPYI